MFLLLSFFFFPLHDASRNVDRRFRGLANGGNNLTNSGLLSPPSITQRDKLEKNAGVKTGVNFPPPECRLP